MIAVDSVCERWIGTPWAAGQACRGAGVDCIHFAVAVWDELAGATTELPPAAQDASMHAGAAAALTRAVRALDRAHGVQALAQSACLQPADLVVTRVGSAGAAGHVYVVGNRHCYHACQRARSVVRTGRPATSAITHIFRARWAQGA